MRTLSDFDVRQKLAFSVLWELPRPNSSSAFLNKFLSRWQLADVTILQSGSPFSVWTSAPFEPVYNASGVIIGNSGGDYNADGGDYDFPNTPAFGNSKSGLSRSDYIKGIFTASAFPVPALGQEGNLGKTTFIGPGFANSDFSIFKNTKIPWFVGKEGADLQFRGEFFNVFNRVNLTQVDGDLVDPTFGTSTGTYAARNIQFSLRLTF